MSGHGEEFDRYSRARGREQARLREQRDELLEAAKDIREVFREPNPAQYTMEQYAALRKLVELIPKAGGKR